MTQVLPFTEIVYTFFYYGPDQFGWGSLFLIFQWISGLFVLILFLRQLSTSKEGITVGGWRIHILVQYHISFNDEHQTMSKPKILMVLNLFCGTILCIYLCLSISLSKKFSYCHQYFFIACIQAGVFRKFFLTFWQSEPHCPYKMCYY